jgi:hypothetical protein
VNKRIFQLLYVKRIENRNAARKYDDGRRILFNMTFHHNFGVTCRNYQRQILLAAKQKR